MHKAETRLRFDAKKRKLIKRLFACNASGVVKKLDSTGEWRLDNDLAPWSLHADIKFPVRFGTSIVSVNLEVPRGLESAEVSIGLYPARMFFVDQSVFNLTT